MTIAQFEEDPTAFRPMKVTASKVTPVGFEIEPIIKKYTLDKGRIELGWPTRKTLHTDYELAHRAHLREPIAPGLQIIEYIGELLIKFFGSGYLGGNLSVVLVGMVFPEDTITTKGVVRDRVVEDDAIRLVLDVWCENKHAEKVIVGTASGLVH